MPDLDRLQSFIDRVVHGDHVEAIEEFYHDDATMQENLSPPRIGLKALINHERQGFARVNGVTTHPPRIVLRRGDDVVIHWIFDAHFKDGATRRLEELSLQRWRGDRIAVEQFFYDSATAWRALDPPEPMPSAVTATAEQGSPNEQGHEGK